MKTSPLSFAPSRRWPAAAATLALAGALSTLLLAAPTGLVHSNPLSPAQSPVVVPVETAPVETILDHPGVPDAWQVWPMLMSHAYATLDVASFYFSNSGKPPGADDRRHRGGRRTRRAGAGAE